MSTDRDLERDSPLTWSWVDGAVGLVLTALAVTWSAVFWRAGLRGTPDSGYYLYFAARLHQHLDYASASTMYAPGFPIALALSMVLAQFPGQAAVLVLGVSLLVAMVGTYVAARVASAPCPVAFVGALWLFVWPSATEVYANVWSEGLLIGTLAGAAACFGLWLRTERALWLTLACVAAASAALTKYVAAVAPPVLFVVGLLVLWRRARLRSVPRLAGSLGAACIPVAAALIYNRVQRGVWTGHLAAHISLASNFVSLKRTLASRLPQELWLLCALGAVVLVLQFQRGRRADPAWWAAMSTGLLGLAYGAGLVLSASVLGVDKLEGRLVWPVEALIFLFALQSVGLSCSWVRLPRWAVVLVSGAVVLLFVSAGAQNARAQVERLAALSSGNHQRQVPSYQEGFGRSEASRALSNLLERELAHNQQVSFTFLELGAEPGRVFRAWYEMASALARAPIRCTRCKLVDVERDVVQIAPDGVASSKRLLVLVPALAEKKPLARRGRGLRRGQMEQLVEQATDEILSRVADTLRAHGRGEHLLLVSEHAGWFRIGSRAESLGLAVTPAPSLPGYAVYQIRSAP